MWQVVEQGGDKICSSRALVRPDLSFPYPVDRREKLDAKVGCHSRRLVTEMPTMYEVRAIPGHQLPTHQSTYVCRMHSPMGLQMRSRSSGIVGYWDIGGGTP
jgi:hypothetical protein